MWVWVALIPLSYVMKDSVVWVVFMSHYAIIAAHMAAKEGAASGDIVKGEVTSDHEDL